MVTYLHNKYGDIACFIEWWLVDQSGDMSEKGDFCFVNHYYVCPKYREKGLLKKLITRMNKLAPHATRVYWQREKRNGRISLYNINRLMKYARR